MVFSIVILLELLIFGNRVYTFLELPHDGYQDPSMNENTIQDTTKKLLSTFDTNVNKDSQRINDYFNMQDYLLSLTSKDYEQMKEISDFTKYNNKIDNVTAKFIATLDDLIREDTRKLDEGTTEVLDANLRSQVDNFLNKIKKLRENFVDFESYKNMNEEVLKYISSREASSLAEENINSPETTSNITEDDIDIWVSSGRRIYRGERTKIKYFPFMAGVLILNSFTCAGSIIKSDLIITATSCIQLAWNNRFFRENPAFISVRVGSSFYNAGGEVIPVLEIYFHPTYNPKTLKDNISILRLVRRIKFSKSNRNRVKRIEYDRRPSSLPFNTPGITIVGWGAKTRSNTLHNPWKNILSCAVIDVYDRRDCQDIYSKEYVTKRNFCAGFTSRGGGACNRDIGGPGLSNSLLMGVISFGSPVCGAPDTPTVFTKIGYYADWIDEIMTLKVPNVKRKTTTTENPYDHYYLPFGSTTKVNMVYPILNGVTQPSSDYMNILHKKRLRIEDTEEAEDEEQPFNNYLKTVFSNKRMKDHNKSVVKEKKMVTVMDLADEDQSTQKSEESSVDNKDVLVDDTENFEYENNIDSLRNIESVTEKEVLGDSTNEAVTNELSGNDIGDNSVENPSDVADDDLTNVDVGIEIFTEALPVEQQTDQVPLQEGKGSSSVQKEMSDYEDLLVTNKPIDTATNKKKEILIKKKHKKNLINATRENTVIQDIINTLIDDVIKNNGNNMNLNVNNVISTRPLNPLVKKKDKTNLKRIKNNSLERGKPGDIDDVVFTMLYVGSNETLDNVNGTAIWNESNVIWNKDKEKKEGQNEREKEKTKDLTYRNAKENTEEEDILNYILSY